MVQTIPEAVRARPNSPLIRGRMADVQPTTLHDLVTGADLVLDATVAELSTYLSSNQESLLTDFQVFPARVLVGNISTEPKPDASSPAILTMYGGELTVDGIKVTDIDHALRKLETGHRYLLFVKRFGPAGHFSLYKAAAFEVGDHQALKSLLTRDEEHVFGEIIGTPFDEAVSKIEAIAAAK